MKVILTDTTGLETENIPALSTGELQGKLLHEPEFYWVLFKGQTCPIAVHESQVEAWQ